MGPAGLVGHLVVQPPDDGSTSRGPQSQAQAEGVNGHGVCDAVGIEVVKPLKIRAERRELNLSLRGRPHPTAARTLQGRQLRSKGGDLIALWSFVPHLFYLPPRERQSQGWPGTDLSNFR